MEKILSIYYANNAKKLHSVVDKMLLKFGGLSYKDMDDFYSLANEVFVDVIKRYDNSQSFDSFLYICLSNKIKSEMSKRNCEKRKADRMSISIDTPIGDEENLTLKDIIPDSMDVERKIFEETEEGYSKKMMLYLNKLSNLQKEILKLIIAGYNQKEIINQLHITNKQYSDCKTAIHSYRNVSVLF